MKAREVLMSTLNIIILSIFYTLFGAGLSFGLKAFFSPYDDNWAKQSFAFKIGDIGLQLSIIGIVAFWTTYIIKDSPPVFPVSKEMDSMIDTYISGIFFIYSIFIFFDPLWEKIRHMSDNFFGKQLSRKMDNIKNTGITHIHGV